MRYGLSEGFDERVGRRTILRGLGAVGTIGLSGCITAERDDRISESGPTELIQRGFEATGVDAPFETTIYANAENGERSRWAQLVQHELNETGLFDVDFEQLEWGATSSCV